MAVEKRLINILHGWKINRFFLMRKILFIYCFIKFSN